MRLPEHIRKKYDSYEARFQAVAPYVIRPEDFGDELFMSMLEFAQAGQKGFRQQAAGLAILSHLFHLCEVFEK